MTKNQQCFLKIINIIYLKNCQVYNVVEKLTVARKLLRLQTLECSFTFYFSKRISWGLIIPFWQHLNGAVINDGGNLNNQKFIS